MADKDRTPSETAMEAARRLFNMPKSAPAFGERGFARIIDEAYAPLRDKISRVRALKHAAINEWHDLDFEVRRATPGGSDGK